ncbi:MAG TPA: hypothetical protein VNS55_07490 [Nocardioides sp.]|nr:hypothetical protein [Nocardioides sp.]
MESRSVGRFEVLGPTTVGGADALAAVDPATGAAVVLRRVEVADHAAADRWAAYVARLAGLDHPGIARVRELLLADGRAYVVQDRVDGPALAELLAAVRPTEEQALGVVLAVLDALVHAHAAGVVTGSLDPSGVVVDAAGAAHLVDVGLTGAFGAPAAQAYAAPERLTGQTLTAASDVYSAAAVAAHLLRGAPTLPPSTDGLEPGAGAVLAPALAVDPASRPSAADLAAALAALGEERGGPDWRIRASLSGLVVGGGAGAGAALGAAPAAAAPAAGGLGGLAAGTPGATSAAAGHGAAAAAVPGAASAPAGVAGVPSAPAGPALGHGASTGASSGPAGAHGASSAAAPTTGHGASTGASSAASHGAGHGAAGAGKGGLALKAGLGAGAVAVGAGVVAAVFLLTGGHTEQVRVPATSDVYLAGTDEVELGDPGTEPIRVDVDGAGTVSFENVDGKLAACGGCEPEDVDGGNVSFGSTALDAVNGIAGVQHDERTLFLVGVFVGSDPPVRTDVVDLTDADSEARQHPALGQPFFVGDGLAPNGDQQEVTVPDGAQRLYLGFADGFSFAGAPGAYGDNSGTVSLDVHVD